MSQDLVAKETKKIKKGIFIGVRFRERKQGSPVFEEKKTES